MVDYFSRFIEIAKLTGESSVDIIRHMKSIIARHGKCSQTMGLNLLQLNSSSLLTAMDFSTRLVVLAILSQM